MKTSNKKVIHHGEWLSFRTMEIENKDSKPIIYEYVTCSEKKADGGVEIIPIMKKEGKLYVVLIKNYRYPIEQYCMEFPAGLVDPGEEVDKTALRELKEETGYTAQKMIKLNDSMLYDPWKSTDTAGLYLALINGDDPINKDIKQTLDDIERIEVILVEWDNIEERLKELQTKYALRSSLVFLVAYKQIIDALQSF